MLGKKTGGRKKGTPNKKKADPDKEKDKKLPLDYMLEVMRDESVDPQRRDEMAKGAAPYLHAKRAPEDKHGRSLVGYTLIQTPLGDDD